MDSINENGKKLLSKLSNNKLDFEQQSEILSELRVLTREKALNTEVLDQNCIESLVKYSSAGHTEAQKCLSNLILNYERLRDPLIEPYLDCVEARLVSIKIDPVKPYYEVLYYDLRIIFLLSALCPSARAKIRDRLLNPLLQITSKEADEFSRDNYLLIVESLKILFNLTLENNYLVTNWPPIGEVIKKLFSIVGDDKDQLLVNLIHLLTNMPNEVYSLLTDEDADKVLEYLENLLKTQLMQKVLPILNVCANICKYNEPIRERWYNEIIGSVKEFDKRPEEYDTLRGRLVKLMTSVDVHIKDIAAEFLHGLFGGDTEKFITYTGFGNSAAFLASRGLLTKQVRRSSKETDDCTTEDINDYRKLRDKINPITGKVEGPKKNPMNGMTEEEKEYHAHELANAITRLSNLGLVKPMQLNDNGQLSNLQPNNDNEEKS